MSHPDDGHQEDGKKQETGRLYCKREEQHDSETKNTQQKTLRQEAWHVEEAGLEEGSTATEGNLRDSDC